MFKKRSVRITAIVLAAVLLLSMVASAALNYDLNGDGKTNVWDLQLALNDGASKEDQDAALKELLGAGDELHKNAEGQWEIYTSLGLYNMAKHAKAGDTFVLKQDIDMEGALWTPVESFNGKFIGSEKYTVSNMKITQSVGGNMGFFGSIAEGGNIYRLNLKDMDVVADSNTTSIGLVAGSCAGKLDACTATGFITDERTTLPADLVVGGLVGTLQDSGEVATHVENMMPALGQEAEIPNISAKIGVRAVDTDTYKASVKIVGDPGNGTVDPMALLEDLTGVMPDPSAIAWVKNGDVTVFPLTVEDMLAQISADGNSEVTLQGDITYHTSITVPYSSTWDLNGYTIRTNPDSGYGLHILATGTDNKVTTVKNGSIYHYGVGVRVAAGGVIVSNMKLYGTNAPCVGIYDTSSDYNDINVIEDSELYHSLWGVFVYNTSGADFSNVNITVQRSKLVAYKSAGSALFVKHSKATGGTVTLGYDVEMYTYGSTVVSGNTLIGVDPVKLESTADVEADGVVYKGLNHWTTNEAVIATEVIAEVTNNGDTVQVTNTKDLAAAVSSTGNTQVKLLKDITCNAAFKLPYSCTIDLNNYSITNTSTHGLWFTGVGSENTVTYVKNGTLNHNGQGIRMETGSVDISNVSLIGMGTSSAVSFLDTNAAYRANNKIDNCYIYNPKSHAVLWNVANQDFSNTGVTITNSTLICPNTYVFGYTSGTSSISGVVTLGEHVEMYGKTTALGMSKYRYSGLMAGRTENVSVTLKDGTALSGLNNWSTDKQTDAINVLLLGNSLSTTIPEELYQIARADGIALNVTDLYHAGAMGYQHQEWITNNSEEYEYRVYNDMGFWYHGDIKTVQGAVDYMEWDHVSYQEFITYGKVPSGTAADAIAFYEDSVNWIHDYLKTETPNAQHYHYQHWAWQVGHSSVANTDRQTKLFEAIYGATHYFAEQNEVKLIPCGEAWQLARADSLIGDTMCKDDNLHDNGPTGGQYLNGCVFYEVMFQNTCIGDTWRAPNGNSPSEEIHQALQQYAHQAVAAVHGNDYAK